MIEQFQSLKIMPGSDNAWQTASNNGRRGLGLLETREIGHRSDGSGKRLKKIINQGLIICRTMYHGMLPYVCVMVAHV